MNPVLTVKEAENIALQYYEKYYAKIILDYKIINSKFLCPLNRYSENAVWDIMFDVDGWDDMWFSIIISDDEKKVICCSNTWSEVYYPHLEQDIKKIKLTPKERRLKRSNNEK